MMRIFAGKHKGRKIETVDDKSLRPTTGMTRESIFNILSHGQFHELLQDAQVADLFCGSGALGLEALSRGAKHVIFIDKSQEHLNLARKNADHFGENANVTFIRCDSAKPPLARQKCDLVFMDPPYNSSLAPTALHNLEVQGWLKEGAVIVVEIAKHEKFTTPEHFTLLDNRTYGKTQVIFLEWGTTEQSGDEEE